MSLIFRQTGCLIHSQSTFDNVNLFQITDDMSYKVKESFVKQDRVRFGHG